MSADLVAFLRARLDDDEAGVRPYVNEGGECRPWRADEVGGTVRVSPVLSGDDGVIARAATHIDAVHIARHDPARVLRQVEAGRAIVELAWHHLGDDDYAWGMEEAKRQVLCHLAAIYRDHEDYREEWAL